MKRTTAIKQEFVEFAPEVADMEQGTIYIALLHTSTAVHLCCCGCGQEIVTPFAPTDWKFFFDGKTVSLCPSIGNWSLPCESHYWIRRGKIEWADSMTKAEIAAVRADDNDNKANYYDRIVKTESLEAFEKKAEPNRTVTEPATKKVKTGWWETLKAWFKIRPR